MGIWYSKEYTRALVQSTPVCLFIYGDNLLQQGLGGQAIIRHEPNTFGIPTKRAPNRLDYAYFKDTEEELNAVRTSLRELWKLAQKRPIVFPYNGVGTGLARMEECSPKIYAYMCRTLKDHFGIINGMGDDSRLIEEVMR